MKKNRSDKLIIIIAVMIIVVFISLALFTINQEQRHIDKIYESELLTLGTIIAVDDDVIEKLSNEEYGYSEVLNSYYDADSELSSIMILGMNSTIYYSLDNEIIGQKYNGGDEVAALDGQRFVTVVETEDHDMDGLQAFVPVYSDSTTQIGVISVNILVSQIDAVKLDKAITILSGFGIGLLFSLFSLGLLRIRFKSDLFGFSPSEIAILYAENKSIIEQLNEAVISIDKDYKITTINLNLKKVFDLDNNAIGQKVFDVFPHVDFEDIINNDRHTTNKYRKINKKKFLMNAFPLYMGDEIIGATAIFRSHLEVDTLLDQISGYRQIAQALRSQKHEFQNKLHVVLGLIKMKDYLKAENYIMENVYTTNLASDYYSSRIKDDRILALFIGKEIQSREFNATLLLTSDSYLTKTHHPINSDDIVLVLGNLVDNSFEAYIHKDMEDKKIVVDIFEDDDKIKITVIDQAGGIDNEVIDKMFERGISTKNGDSRGTGLSLVNEIVTVYNGVKNVSSTREETKIEIILMKVRT